MSRTATSILGTRIRECRRALGITQAELARRVGISASYLNLIEHNKRGIAGALLRRTASALDMDLDELDGAAERRLLEELNDLAHRPELAGLEIEAEQTGELIGRYPGWARALAALARSEREAQAVARALSDRMHHDPFLADAVHRMLTQVAGVRSAIEILHEFPDIDAERRQRFQHIIHEESRSLTEVGEALAVYFDKADAAEPMLTPLDEVDALFEACGNRFEPLETAASALRPELHGEAPADRLATARRLVSERLGEHLDAVIAEHPQVETDLARARARHALLDYAVGALLAPMAAFARQASECGYDVELLAEQFAIGIEVACLRLTALPDGDGVPRFAYLRVNAAGTVVDARALPGLGVPRHGSACPLWVMYRAQQSPQAMIRQRALLPSGARYIFVARARHTGPTGFGKPRHYLTDMLAMSEDDAAHTIYAPDSSVPVEPVGQTCRSCARRACEHRVADPLAG